MRRNKTLWLSTACLAIGFHNSVAQDRQEYVTRINLKTYGWAAPRGDEYWFPTYKMAVDHQGRVLVGYISSVGATTKDHALSFHILRLARDGTLELSLALPTARRDGNELYLDAEDHLLVKANNELQILIENEESREKKQHWEPLVTCVKKCRLSQSPSRRILLVDDSANNPRLTFIDTSSSQARVTQHCWGPPSTYVTASFSDESAYGIEQRSSNPVIFRWPLCDYEHVSSFKWSGMDFSIHALNDESIAIIQRNVVRVLSYDGKVKYELTMARGESPRSGNISVSEKGDRFAALIWRSGLTWVPSDPSEGHILGIRIAVYDSKNGKQVSSMPVNLHVHHVLQFSLSPDAHRLALLEDGVLSISNLR
jgi:hypothetical protein